MVIMIGLLISCNKDLNRLPANAVFADSVYSTPNGYKLALANIYGAYELTGTSGPGSSECTALFIIMY